MAELHLQYSIRERALRITRTVGEVDAAVCCIHRESGKEYWDFTVLAWSEDGLECDGESWLAWSEEDIEWIARIPAPPKGP